jgi:outer membrane protein assembly factor BamB
MKTRRAIAANLSSGSRQVFGTNNAHVRMHRPKRTARLGRGPAGQAGLAALAVLTVLITPVAMAPTQSAFAAAASGRPAVSHVLRAGTAKAAPATAPANATWPTFHGNAQLTGVSQDTAVSASNAGQLGVRWMTHTFGPVLSSPVTHYSGSLGKTLAYVANEKGFVEAINTADGSIVWSDSFGVPIHATPTVSGSHVWVGTAVSSRMIKLDANTGNVLCQVSLGPGIDDASPVVATPPGGATTLFVGVQDNGAVQGPMMAINDSTCQVEWQKTPYPQFSGTWSPDSYGVNANGVPLVIFGSGDPDCAVYALNALSGDTLWRVQSIVGGLNDFGAGTVISPPGRNNIADGMAYVPGKDRILYAIDLTTGQLKWTFDYGAATGANHDGGRSAPALVGKTLVFGTPVGVAAVDAVTGKQIWLSENAGPPDTEILSSPLITGPAGSQVVVYGDLNGKIEVLSLATGAVLYTYQTKGYVISSAADSAGNLIIGSSDGFLYDLAIGGSNGTPPKTAITAPSSGSVIANPGANPVVAKGTAQAGSAPVTAVDIAVQMNGTAGPWWNAATHSWQPGPTYNHATLSGSGTINWSLGVPAAPSGGVLQFTARAVGGDGLVDQALARTTVTVRPSTTGPHVYLSAAQASPNSSLSVSGSGFKPQEQVNLSLPGASLAAVTAGAKGGFPKTPVQIPATYDFGLSAVTGTGQTSGSSATAPLYVTGPWSEFGHDPQRTSDQPNDRVLSIEVTPGKNYRLNPYFVYSAAAPIDSSPAVVDQMAFAGDGSGTLSAVRITTGGLAWSASPGGTVTSSPAVDSAAGLVVVGSSNNTVSAYAEKTGKPAWTATTGGAVTSSPLIYGGVVYVGSKDGKVYAIDEATGNISWTFTVPGAVVGSPAFDPGASTLVVADNSGKVTALRVGATSASQRWQADVGAAVDNSPLIAQKQVFVGSTNGVVSSLSESAGTLNWSKAVGTSITGSMAYQASHLYVGAADKSLTALQTTDGSVMWSEPLAGPITGVSVTGGMLFTESSDGTVTGLRIGGEIVWLAKTGAGLSGTPTIMDNSVFVGAEDNGLYAYTPFGEPVV